MLNPQLNSHMLTWVGAASLVLKFAQIWIDQEEVAQSDPLLIHSLQYMKRWVLQCLKDKGPLQTCPRYTTLPSNNTDLRQDSKRWTTSHILGSISWLSQTSLMISTVTFKPPATFLCWEVIWKLQPHDHLGGPNPCLQNASVILITFSRYLNALERCHQSNLCTITPFNLKDIRTDICDPFPPTSPASRPWLHSVRHTTHLLDTKVPKQELHSTLGCGTR